MDQWQNTVFVVICAAKANNKHHFNFAYDPKSKGAPDDKNFRIYKNDLIL